MYVWVRLRPHTHTSVDWGLLLSTIFPTEGLQWRTPPPRPPPRSLFRERYFIPRAPFIDLSKCPVDEPSSRFPKRGFYRKRCPSPEPLLPILQGLQQGTPPSRFPSQSSHRERHSTSRAPFNHISKSPVDEPTPVCPTEPPWREMPIPRAFLRALNKGAPPLQVPLTELP